MSWIGEMTVTGVVVDIPVVSADSGVTYSVLLGPGEEHAAHLKANLANLSNVPPADQILLVGPPYKRLDSSFTRTPLSKGKRMFLYDRRLLQNDHVSSNETSALEPAPEPIPTEPSEMAAELKEAMSEVSASNRTPLLQTVFSYERQFMLSLNKGEATCRTAEKFVDFCTRFEIEAQSQKDALSAATNNLKDHADVLKANFMEVTELLEGQERHHQTVLDSFETDLAALGDVALHPAIIPSLQTALKSSTAPKTLLDCVPVARERAFVSACRESHRRVQVHLAEGKESFAGITAGVEKIVLEYGSNGSVFDETKQEPRHRLKQNEFLQQALSSQYENLEKLRTDHQIVARQATEQFKHAINKDMQQSGSVIIALVQDFDEKFNAQSAIVASMKQINGELMNRCTESKTKKLEQNQVLRCQLKLISSLQSKIQELQKWLQIMKQAKEQKEEQFIHLEKIRRMPSAYAAMLSEIVRQKSYYKVVSSRVAKLAKEASALRSAEIVARDSFLRREMVGLPVAFVNAVPALSMMPPQYAPSVAVTDDSLLPDIETNDDQLTDSELLSLLNKKSPSAHSKESRGSVIIEADEDDDSSDAELKVKNAELRYHNAILRNEVFRLRNMLRRNDPSLPSVAAVDQSTNTEVVPAKAVHVQTDLNLELLVKEREAAARVDTMAEAMASVEATTKRWYAEEGILPHAESAARVGFKLVLNEAVRLHENTAEALDPSSVSKLVGSVERALKSASWKLREKAAEMETRVAAATRTASYGRISFRDFIAGDLALFLPTTDGPDRVYLAFHIGCPYYYLAGECVEEIRQQLGKFPDFILGRIILVEQFLSKPNEENPYNVPAGKMFSILTATNF